MNAETMVLLTGLIGTVMVTGLLGAAIAGAYFFGRSRGAPPIVRPDDASGLERLDRIERLLLGLSLDMERIGEFQRVAARTLQVPAETTRQDSAPRGDETG